MKKTIKRRTKKGFTLLEVLLATAILVIISSMLMQGFITTMGYSYNSSVYSRSAAFNSKLCITQLAQWSSHADRRSYSGGSFVTNEHAAAYDTVEGQADSIQTLQFDQSSAGRKLGTIRVALLKKSAVDPSLSAGTISGFQSTETIDNDKYADNRYILFYYPGYNADGKSYYGNTHIYMYQSKKCWGHDKLVDPVNSVYKPKFDRWFDPADATSLTANSDDIDDDGAGN